MDNTNTTTHTLRNDGQRNVRFVGSLIASSDNHSYFGAGQNRWSEYDLYRTAAGKYICQRTRISQWQGEGNSHEVSVCGSEAQVIDFFGEDDLAKELYSDAGIDAAEMVA